MIALTGTGMLFTNLFYMQNLSGSLLFSIMLDASIYVWVGPIAGTIQTLLIALPFIKEKNWAPRDTQWRKASGFLCGLAILTIFLPFMSSYSWATLTGDAQDAPLLARSLSGMDLFLSAESSLSTLVSETGQFSDVLTADLAQLEPLSSEGNNIAGLFKITTRDASANPLLLVACAALLLAAILQFFRKVDRWIPAFFACVGALLSLFCFLTLSQVDSTFNFGGATHQLLFMGLGYVTLAPLFMAVFSIGSAACAAMSIRCAQAPYFINPIAPSRRLRATAITLAGLTLLLMLMPSYSLNLVRPGKNKNAATITLSGYQLLTGTEPTELSNPTDTRGKSIYTEEVDANGLSLASAVGTLRGINTRYRMLATASFLLIACAIVCLSRRKFNHHIAMVLCLIAFGVQLVAMASLLFTMPKALGNISPTLFLYATLPLLIFTAFFSYFAEHVQLPKKYVLFLMLLPFLIAVFLFSYLPLYGWSYAFYNYKFGLPMSEQEFVGLKWFAELITNAGQRTNIIRVMKNTFGMSGLGLLTSWMPMAFAILLNEVGNTRYKKFIQIFTTLPNFISWALVFSFAMVMFSLDTGIVNKVALSLGFIDQPVAWLNSSQNIWLKMWAWGTWKGLGWGSIMYLAAIAGIDQELFEAARVDGAGRLMQIVHITIPSLLPTFFVLLLLSISNIVNNGMEQYLVFQNSMNKGTIEVLDLYVYNITIASKGTSLYSFGTAIGILKTLFSVTMLFAANTASKKLRGESIV